MTEEENVLKEGLEKDSENQDNRHHESALVSRISIGCAPFMADVKLPGIITPLWDVSIKKWNSLGVRI